MKKDLLTYYYDLFKFRIWLILFIIVFLNVSCSNSTIKKPPLAKKGFLDLSNWDFNTDGNVPLNGEWEFVFSKFLHSADFDSFPVKTYIPVPGTWKGKSWNNKKLPAFGYASYRLKIRINDKMKSRMGIHSCKQGTSYRCYVNDSLLIVAGVPGKSAKTYSPAYLVSTEYFSPGNDTITIVYHISNFDYRKGGLWQTVTIGEAKHIFLLNRYNLLTDTFLAGFLILFAFIFLCFYFFRNSEKASLYFGIGSLVMLMRMIVTHEQLITQLFPGFNWEIMVKFEIIPMFLGPWMILRNVVGVILKKDISLVIYKIFDVILIICSLVIILTNARINSYLVLPGQIYMVVLSVLILVQLAGSLRKNEGAWILLIGLLCYFITIVTEILYFTYVIYWYVPVVFGLIICCFSQALLISRMFSVAMIRIENFAGELEHTVKIRTEELRIEKDKADKLLLNVLPEAIAHRLKEGETIIADQYKEASVIFIDIVDFTKISDKADPEDLLFLLNDIFTCFDKISAKYGLEKIKTIGDCYMAASGIPVPDPYHLEAAVKMALEVMKVMEDFVYYPQKSDLTGESWKIQFRIGLNCGPVIAGVIGEQKFIYDLWGDMVNTASRMETYGEIDKIQCTKNVVDILSASAAELGITFKERGEIEVKGKGKMRTWFIIKTTS